MRPRLRDDPRNSVCVGEVGCGRVAPAAVAAFPQENVEARTVRSAAVEVPQVRKDCAALRGLLPLDRVAAIHRGSVNQRPPAEAGPAVSALQTSRLMSAA